MGDWWDGGYETSFVQGSSTYSNPGVPCASDSTFLTALQISGQLTLDGGAVYYGSVISVAPYTGGGAGTSSAQQCPLVGIVGDYNLGNPNRVGDPVHPLFSPAAATALDAAIAAMNAQGIDPTITDGFRTLADQANAGSGNHPKAPPGQSWHEVGLAVDISEKSVSATQWGEIVGDMKTAGFTWGGAFTGRGYDPIHFQFAPDNVHANGTVTSGAPSMSAVTARESEHPTGFY